MAQTTKHARFCEHAKNGTQAYIEKLCDQKFEPVKVTPSVYYRPTSKGDATPQTDASVTQRIETIKMVGECTYRSRRTSRPGDDGLQRVVHVFMDGEVDERDCGCGLNRCRLNKGRGDGFVSLDDCIQCVEKRGAPPAPVPEPQAHQ
jgi:hypothetical protein